MDTIQGERPTTSATQGQTGLPLEQAGCPATASDPEIPAVSTHYSIPKNSSCENCSAGTVIFDDPEDKTRRWVICRLGQTLATGDLPETMKGREVLLEEKKAQKKADAKGTPDDPECPGLKAARILNTHIEAKVARALAWVRHR